MSGDTCVKGFHATMKECSYERHRNLIITLLKKRLGLWRIFKSLSRKCIFIATYINCSLSTWIKLDLFFLSTWPVRKCLIFNCNQILWYNAKKSKHTYTLYRHNSSILKTKHPNCQDPSISQIHYDFLVTTNISCSDYPAMSTWLKKSIQGENHFPSSQQLLRNKVATRDFLYF